MQIDYAGDASRLIDVCRASIVVKNRTDIATVLDMIKSKVHVVRLKDRFANPQRGYRDMCLTIRIAGHLCEVQVHIESLISVKKTVHSIYSKYRVLDASTEEAKTLAREIESIYELAWSKAA